MPTLIRENELTILQALANSGDRIAYYSQLAAWGDEYGRLALGVVNNDTLAGATANVYFVQHAGAGGGNAPVLFDILANISLDLMRADLAARLQWFGEGQTGRLAVDRIHGYHTNVFAFYDVGTEAWTPDFALNRLETVAAREALWTTLLAAGGLTGNATAWLSTLLNAVSSDVAGFAEYAFELTSAGALATTSQSTDYGPYTVSIGGGVVAGGNDGDNHISGSAGNDILMGFDGADQIDGGAGDDVLYGGNGGDKFDGGEGRDRVSYVNSDRAVRIDLSLETQRGGDAGGDTYKDIEGIRGSEQGDKLTGDRHFNILIGGGGNDTLTNQKTGANLDDSNNFLKDDQGKDIATGTFDILNGGGGFDTYEINSNVRFWIRFTASGMVLDRAFELVGVIA